ncbi:MAG: hypothetical protein AAFQ61_09065 [Cyanobacteria bacterium J06626_23]
MRHRFWLISGGLATATATGIYGTLSSTAQGTWQPAGEVLPTELLEQIQSDHLQPEFLGNADQMRAWKIQQSGQPIPLYLIDSRLTESDEQPLCGQSGCAFFAYVPNGQHYRSVWNAYLDPRLPPDLNLITATDNLQNRLPELILYQLERGQLQQFTLAFDGDRYEVVEAVNLPNSHE